MTSSAEHDHAEAGGHDPHEGEHKGLHEQDWNDEAFVARWLDGQTEREAQRRRQFAIIRALIPKDPDQEFRYINLGAGPGNLDEVLLSHFPGAQATLVDVSLPLLEAARQRLGAFAGRVEYVHANLDSPDWTGAVSGPFDFAFSVLSVHHAGGPKRIRELYAETYRLLGHGGMFLNLDYVRPSRPSLTPLSQWVQKDPEAGLSGRGFDHDPPGSLLEHLGWLSEAGFPGVEVFWKEMNTAPLCGIRGDLQMPEGYAPERPSQQSGGHAHSHAE